MSVGPAESCLAPSLPMPSPYTCCVSRCPSRTEHQSTHYNWTIVPGKGRMCPVCARVAAPPPPPVPADRASIVAAALGSSYTHIPRRRGWTGRGAAVTQCLAGTGTKNGRRTRRHLLPHQTLLLLARAQLTNLTKGRAVADLPPPKPHRRDRWGGYAATGTRQRLLSLQYLPQRLPFKRLAH